MKIVKAHVTYKAIPVISFIQQLEMILNDLSNLNVIFENMSSHLICVIVSDLVELLWVTDQVEVTVIAKSCSFFFLLFIYAWA